MTIEIRVPISPTPSFINRVLLLAASVREFYPDAIVRVYAGQEGGFHADDPGAIRLREAFSDRRIPWHWVSAEAFAEWKGTRSPYLATMNARFDPVTIKEVSHVLIMDADVICTGRFDEVLESRIAGVMTHVPPMAPESMRGLWWGFTHRPPVAEYLHSGAGIMCASNAFSPWYVNSGVVFLPRARFEDMIGPYHHAIDYLKRTLPDTYWFDQLALGLAAAMAEAPEWALSLRYNFPNQAAFDQAHPEELADCRFLHYLRTDTVDRDRDFADVNAMTRFIVRPGLVGSNHLLQRRVGQLLNKVWPAEEYDAADAPHA